MLVYVSVPYSDAFTVSMSELQGSGLDIGHCSTVGAGSLFAFPLQKADINVLGFA